MTPDTPAPDRTPSPDRAAASATTASAERPRWRHSIGTRDVTEWRGPVDSAVLAAHRRVSHRIGERRALILTASVGAAVAVASTWAATLVYDGVTDRNGISSLDVPALRRAKRLRSPVVDGVAAGIARVFGPVGMPLVTAAAALSLDRAERSRAPLVLLGVAAVGSLAMTIGGKHVVRRHRPPHRDAIPPFERSPSFPSGHTLNATVLVGTAAYLLMLRQRRLATQALTAAGAVTTVAGVGLSRVLIGAHWFTDVAVGWALGSGWLSSVITVDRLRMTRERPSSG